MESKSQTILNKNGDILLLSVEDFYNRIVLGDDCFICGAKINSKIKFNDEHILPNWLLTKYNLHNKSITLPNAAYYKYGSYTVSCCKECNSELGRTLEIPISRLLKLPYSEICNLIATDKSHLLLLFKWLNLIFFKTHLKDTSFNWGLDKRIATTRISATYDWADLHHIHCIVRSNYTGALLDTKTIGSIFILPAIQHRSIEPFDFTDNFAGKSIMIRLDAFCIICVLNDSCGSFTLFQNEIKKIKGPLTPFQLREIFTHLVYINIHLKDRPIYYSEILQNGDYQIGVILPKFVQLVDDDKKIITHGELLYHYCKDMIGTIDNREVILSEINQGKRRYLTNQVGEFIDHSKDLENSNFNE